MTMTSCYRCLKNGPTYIGLCADCRDKERKAASHTEQPSPSPNQTGTWDPDWESLMDALWSVLTTEKKAHVVIAAYRSQQAAQGIVEIRLSELGTWIEEEIAAAYEEQILFRGDEAAEEWTQELRNYIGSLASAKDR